MDMVYLKKVKEIATIIGVIATAVTALWGAFKPEKKAEAAYAVTAKHISQIEDEVNNLYDLTSSQQSQIAFLISALNAQTQQDQTPIPIKSSDNKTKNYSVQMPKAMAPTPPVGSAVIKPRMSKPELPEFGKL